MGSMPARSKYTVTYATSIDSSTAGISQPVYYTYYPLYPEQVVPVSSPQDFYALPKVEEKPFDEEAELLAEDF